MANETTWRPYPTHGKPAPDALPETAFAFSARRKLPLTDEGSVRTAIETFAEVGAPDDEREQAFANIRKAAAFYRVPMDHTDWRQLGGRPVERAYERDTWDGKR